MASVTRPRRALPRPPLRRFVGSRVYGWKTVVVKVWTRV